MALYIVWVFDHEVDIRNHVAIYDCAKRNLEHHGHIPESPRFSTFSSSTQSMHVCAHIREREREREKVSVGGVREKPWNHQRGKTGVANWNLAGRL